MKAVRTYSLVIGLAALAMGCSQVPVSEPESTLEFHRRDHSTDNAPPSQDDSSDESGQDDGDNSSVLDAGVEIRTASSNQDAMCNGEFISSEAVNEMIRLTEVTDYEDIYTTYDRIDGIAALFEECGDPWGLFPTTYRHITRRIIGAIETGQIEDQEWGKRIVVDFAGRYLLNLQAVLYNDDPSYVWEHYYYLADRSDVSRTRTVVVAMVAHLTLDLPYALVAVDSTEDHKDDYFVLGELMIEITPDFIEDLLFYYDTDAEDILTGFFMGEWIDGAFGQDTTITLSYQTIRTKSWNNRWLIEQWWGGWTAQSEIYTAFWAVDGVLAGLDAAGTI